MYYLVTYKRLKNVQLHFNIAIIFNLENVYNKLIVLVILIRTC